MKFHIDSITEIPMDAERAARYLQQLEAAKGDLVRIRLEAHDDDEAA